MACVSAVMEWKRLMNTHQIDRLAKMVSKIPEKYESKYRGWAVKELVRLELATILVTIDEDFDWDRWNELCERRYDNART